MLYRVAVFHSKPELVEESKRFQRQARQRMSMLNPVKHLLLQSMADPTQFAQVIRFDDEESLSKYLASDELKSIQQDPTGANFWADRTLPFVVDHYRCID